MKKTIILVGILIWLALAAIFTIFLVVGSSGGSLPGFLSNLTGKDWGNMTFGSSETLIRTDQFDIAGLEKLQFESHSPTVDITFTDSDIMTVSHYDREGAPAFTDTRSGGTLQISLPSHNSFGFFTVSFDPRLEISLPRRFKEAVDISTSSGGIRVTGVPEWGDTALRSSSGSIRLEDGLICGRLDVKSTSGSQRFGDITASSALFSVSSGGIRLNDLTAEGKIEIESTSGSVHAGVLTGSDVSARASSGGVRLTRVRAEEDAELKTTSGSLDAESLTAAVFKIETSSGGIDLGELDGRGSLHSTSGSVSADAVTLRGDITSESSSGSQKLGLAENTNCKLALSSSSGSIHADSYSLSFSDNRGKNGTATVGTGENGTLSVSTSSGSIRIT